MVKTSGQKAMYDRYLLPKKPDGASGPRSYWFGSPVPFGSHIRDPLYDVMALRVSPSMRGDTQYI